MNKYEEYMFTILPSRLTLATTVFVGRRLLLPALLLSPPVPLAQRSTLAAVFFGRRHQHSSDCVPPPTPPKPPNKKKTAAKPVKPSLLCERELEESFVKGSGPGGQKINKVRNCVVLKHTITGLSVKVQKTRTLDQNRKIARKELALKVDAHLLGENSYRGIRQTMQQQKKARKKSRARRRHRDRKDQGDTKELEKFP